mmetsp:Transcript_17973/g.23415  ORF Transcript_17973/g.23415 Transcript_17973/m.23415 type:complete len:146 (+) Transcript_17973:34-471(+)
MSLLAARASFRIVPVKRAYSSSKGGRLWSQFWQWTTQERPSWRENPKEAVIICTVFAITGSTSVAVVRPTLNKAGLEGSMRDGPWSYRIISILVVSPIYTCILVSLGTVAGRHRFFANMAQKMLNRFIPPSLRPKAPVCGSIRKN